MKNLSFVVLAAGKGVRMKSDKAKVLHELCGKPMLMHVLDSITGLAPKRVFLVVGYQADRVENYVRGAAPDRVNDGMIKFVLQKDQLGSGHAVKCAAGSMEDDGGDIVVMYADTPLISRGTLEKLLEMHAAEKNNMTMLTAVLENPYGYGRIMRNGVNNIIGIKEELDLNDSEKKIREINVGVYCVGAADLLDNIGRIEKNPLKKEYYFTDLIKILAQNNKKIAGMLVADNAEITGINSPDSLEHAEKILEERKKCTRK